MTAQKDHAKMELLVLMAWMTTVAPAMLDIRERIAALVRKYCKLRIYLQKGNLMYSAKA